MVGAAGGGVVGGLAHKAVAELYDATIEDLYWRGNHTKGEPRGRKVREDLKSRA